MRRLPKPVEDAEDVFRLCISRVANAALKNKLTLCAPIIKNASTEYAQKASRNELYQIPLLNNLNGNVSKAEMKAVYKSRMAKKHAPGRLVYDKILASPPNGRCPLCGQRIATTLDHHLAQAYYPALVVTPLNLVPACMDCNKVKLAQHPTTQTEETIHPYFDNIEDELWLHAVVVPGVPTAVVFSVIHPSEWPLVLFRRVEHHFRILELSKLFASHSAEALLNKRSSLLRLYRAGGKQSVRLHLEEEAQSCADNHLNSWQTAMFKALSTSDWFCDGGFI